ncbi:MAG: C10 family peptidase [Prevotella sp.]
MKRLFTLFVIMTIFVCNINASEITRQQARDKAMTFLGKTSTKGLRKARSLVSLKDVDLGVKNLYAFNIEGGGYVITSGDDRIQPVLGYADTGSIDLENIPVNMREWLDAYSQAIILLDQHAETAAAETETATEETYKDRQPVNYLIQSRWGQDTPYNNHCPVYYERKAVTGCVATAMAMVMHYYKWPQGDCKPIAGYTSSTTYFDFEAVLEDLPAVTFDWNNMLDYYGYFDTEEQNTEPVAQLMRYCGQAIRSVYADQVTTAGYMSAGYAMKKYFGYNKNAYHAARNNYTNEEWEDLIYGEIAAGHPVIFGATVGGQNIGHEFVIDGYDGEGMYHVNWGWDGTLNGYFSLSLLDYLKGRQYYMPEYFNVWQQAEIGLYPDETTSDQPIREDLFVNLSRMWESENNIYIKGVVSFEKYQSLKLEFALGTVEADESLNPVMISKEYEPSMDDEESVSYAIPFDKTKLPEGETRLVPMVRRVAPDVTEWQQLGTGKDVVVCNKAGDDLQYKILPEVNLVRTGDIKVTWGTVGALESAELTMDFMNNGDDYNNTVSVYVYDIGSATIDNLGDLPEPEIYTLALNAKPGQTGSVSFPIEPKKKCNYLIEVFTEGDMTKIAHEMFSVDKDPEFYNLSVELYEVYYSKSGKISVYYMINNNDSRNFIVSSSTLDDPYFKDIMVFTDTSEHLEKKIGYNILSGDYAFCFLRFNNPVERPTITMDLYQYLGNENRQFIGSLTIPTSNPDGIVEVENDDVKGKETWTTLGGMTVAKPQKKGIYIKNNRKIVVK